MIFQTEAISSSCTRIPIGRPAGRSKKTQQNYDGAEQACVCESGVATMWNELRGGVLAWSELSDSVHGRHEFKTCARPGSRLEAERRHGAS
ncbi:unnamed protein product [Citrullus colocynthis]|uniref:Uncharacterized protein n=1 Tax=Citrullus colocynthis TaxID=252529 RepID=A0ABP0YR48_9ROSI